MSTLPVQQPANKWAKSQRKPEIRPEPKKVIDTVFGGSEPLLNHFNKFRLKKKTMLRVFNFPRYQLFLHAFQYLNNCDKNLFPNKMWYYHQFLKTIIAYNKFFSLKNIRKTRGSEHMLISSSFIQGSIRQCFISEVKFQEIKIQAFI